MGSFLNIRRSLNINGLGQWLLISCASACFLCFRIHLIPGFMDLMEADWMFEQLLQEIPWGQRTHVRQDQSYDEPRLTAWYGELPYTYSKLTMQANHHVRMYLSGVIKDFYTVKLNFIYLMVFFSLQEENNDYTYVQRVHIPLDHGTLLIMEGATQEDWQHRVPKEYHSREPRINLTFRTMYPDPEVLHP
uniref:Alpha-ketoglutarate-dependent dioxygenase AlkB-like domain-containing protein n=1 Tax=Anolis carolinensis TaxID=28377 RepID=G1K8U9_ANOCA